LEKAARAIKLELYEQEDKARRARKRTSIDTHALARVALEAIREPSVAVLVAGGDVNLASYELHGGGAGSGEIYAAMIDAILNEEATDDLD